MILLPISSTRSPNARLHPATLACPPEVFALAAPFLEMLHLKSSWTGSLVSSKPQNQHHPLRKAISDYPSRPVSLCHITAFIFFMAHHKNVLSLLIPTRIKFHKNRDLVCLVWCAQCLEWYLTPRRSSVNPCQTKFHPGCWGGASRRELAPSY